MSWIKTTEKLLTGVSICNNLDKIAFHSLIDLAYSNVFGDEKEKEEKLVLKFKELVKDQEIVIVCIKTMSYILRRLMVVIGSPDVVCEDLIFQLQMSNEKANELTKYWIEKTKSILNGVVADKELIDVQWDLKVTLSSSTQQKAKFPFGVLRLNNKLHLNMTNEELKNLFTTLESLQNELDLLK